MSGLEYEVRLYAITDIGDSEWSKIATVTVPVLQPGPPDAVGPMKPPFYYVGDIIAVNLHSQRPFEKRSVWHWFLCNSDGMECKLLPVPKRDTYAYRAPEIARGKLIKVQVDYDKDGESYSATNVAGVVHETDRLRAVVTNGQIKVFWDQPEIPSATNYRIRVRLKNSIQPLQWTEHIATSFPYVILGYQVMSGLEYELQVVPFNEEQQSEWSQKTITVIVPDRQAALAEAINVLTDPPYRVGNVIQVSLASQHPFTSRSVWHWFLCDTDGSECKLLPLKQTDSHRLLIPDVARGKLIKVQSDYRKDGISYTARTTIGIVQRAINSDASLVLNAPMPNSAVTDRYKMECPETTATGAEDLFSVETGFESHLYAMQLKFVTVRWNRIAAGGAIEPMCEDLLLATPWGRIAVVRPNGSVEYLNARVPMNLQEMLAHPKASQKSIIHSRVADILLKQHSHEQWELFVTHHYFTGECIRFRLSSTTIIRDGNNITASSTWRTIFDAEPCISLDDTDTGRAGGSMLTYGADHLLIVTGDHGTGGRNGTGGIGNNLMVSQNPEAHLGKLLRVEIETGEVEILAYGLRNPQGFVRDQDGNLWSTEHGPLGGDELNLLQPGNNYGWPLVSYGINYTGIVNTPEKHEVARHEGFTTPSLSWIPSIAPSSIIVNDAHTFPLWGDDLLIATLTGRQGLSLYRVRRVGTEVQYFERIEIGWRIRDITQMPNGQIALLSDDNGRVYFMSRDHSYCYNERVSDGHIYKIDCGP